jgi:hypothetical protein
VARTDVDSRHADFQTSMQKSTSDLINILRPLPLSAGDDLSSFAQSTCSTIDGEN